MVGDIALSLCIPLSAILPGLALSFALFRKGELDLCQRLALSFALSTAIDALAMLWLNQFLHAGAAIQDGILIILSATIFISILAFVVQANRDRLTELLREFLTCSTKIRPMLATLEAPLVGLMAGLVYLLHIVHTGSILTWVAFAALVLILGTCRLAGRRRHMGSPFDIAGLLYVSGGLVGLIYSPDRTISSGAFQCMLAMCFFYYSWLDHPNLATMIKVFIPLSVVGLVVAFLLVFSQAETAAGDPDSVASTYHGLAICLLAVAIILGGVAIFHPQGRTRITAGLISLLLLIAMFAMVHDSLFRFFQGTSVQGRMERWRITASLLRDSPFTGLGLGCWALVYHHSLTIVPPTHVHNAYLELYANFGLLGVIALVVVLGMGCRLALQIVRSPRETAWYGLGVGLIGACLAILVVSIVESAPIGVAVPQTNTYFYLVSPLPWIFCGLLAVAHRLITRDETA